MGTLQQSRASVHVCCFVTARIPRYTPAKSAAEGWGPPTLSPSIQTVCRQNYYTNNPHLQAPRTPRPLNSVDATSAPPFFRRGWVGYTKQTLLSEPSEGSDQIGADRCHTSASQCKQKHTTAYFQPPQAHVHHRRLPPTLVTHSTTSFASRLWARSSNRAPVSMCAVL